VFRFIRVWVQHLHGNAREEHTVVESLSLLAVLLDVLKGLHHLGDVAAISNVTLLTDEVSVESLARLVFRPRMDHLDYVRHARIVTD
jgi:hypothetical protein